MAYLSEKLEDVLPVVRVSLSLAYSIFAGADIGFDISVSSLGLRPLALKCSRQRRELGARGLPMVVFRVGQTARRSWRMAIERLSLITRYCSADPCPPLVLSYGHADHDRDSRRSCCHALGVRPGPRPRCS